MVLGVAGAGDGAGLVNAEFGLDARLGGAFEEAEDVLAVLMLLLLGFVLLGLLFSGSLIVVFVDRIVDFFMRCVQG